MRLSDIKGERLLEVIADIMEPVANIVLDDEVAAAFKREKCPEGVDPRQFTIRKLTVAIPIAIKLHKADIIAVLAAVEGVPSAEYSKNLDIMALFKAVMDFLKDDALLDFLSQFATEAGIQSGAA